MKESIAAFFLILLSVFAFALSIRSFQEKGTLLNNSYLYASKQERKVMEKGPYYRQSAVVFFLIGLIFALNGLTVAFHIEWLVYVTAAVICITLLYAIISSIQIEKRKRLENKKSDSSPMEDPPSQQI